MKHLVILMSTYNGEHYLAEQLDSLLTQDCDEAVQTSFQIIVRDDGSSDKTQDILQEYATKYPQKIHWYQGKNCGVIRSFFELLEKAQEAQYYAFCDQDDVWLPDKMSSAIRVIDSHKDSEVPHLYCCRPKLVNAELEELSSDIKRPKVRVGFGNALIENVVTGCTAVMNASLRKLLIKEWPNFTVMHDRWFYLAAACFGTVDYDETSHICYRQHENNVVGTSSDRFKELKMRIHLFRKKQHDISRQTKEFLRIFGNLSGREDLKRYMSDAQVQQSFYLARELVAAKHSLRRRINLVRQKKVFRQRKNDDRIFRLLILLGCY